MKKILSVLLAALIFASVFGIAVQAGPDSGRFTVISCNRTALYPIFSNPFLPGAEVQVTFHPRLLLNVPPMTGWRFAGWNIDYPIEFVEGTAECQVFTFIMPTSDVHIQANLVEITAECPHYTVTVVGTTGGGEFAAGESVSLALGDPPAGMRIAGINFGENVTGWTDFLWHSAEARFIMPHGDVTITVRLEGPSVCCDNYPDCSCEVDDIGFIMGILRAILNFLARIFPFINWPEI